MSSNKKSEKKLTVYDVAATLKSQYFLVTGSHTSDGCPIIFMLDAISPEPTVDEQRNALVYISTLPKLSSEENGLFCLVIDRRKSSWSNVRRCLALIAQVYECLVKRVVLLQPNTFFQKRFGVDASHKITSEFPSLQMVLIEDTAALVSMFGAENICSQLGGTINGSPDTFIQHRMSIDSLESNCTDLEDRVKELLLSEAQTDFDIPNDVASTEALLNEHAETKTNLTEEITGIKSQGEVALQCLQARDDSLPAVQQMLHVQQVQRLTARLEDLDAAITDFWEKELTKLQDCMKLREFHELFKSLQSNLNAVNETLSGIADYVDTSDQASANARKLEKIAQDAQPMLEQAINLSMEWKARLSRPSMDDLTLNTVGPKCEELVRLHNLCEENLQFKQMLAEKQALLFSHIEQAQKWVTDGLTTSIVDDPSDASDPADSLHQIECHLTVGSYLEIHNHQSFLETFKPALNNKSENLVEEVSLKVKEVTKIYEYKRDALSRRIEKSAEHENKKFKKGMLHPFSAKSVKKKHISGDRRDPVVNTSSKSPPVDLTSNLLTIPTSPTGVDASKVNRDPRRHLLRRNTVGSLIISPVTDEQETNGIMSSPKSPESDSQVNPPKSASPTISADDGNFSQTSSALGADNSHMSMTSSRGENEDTVSSTSFLAESYRDFDMVSQNDSLASETLDTFPDHVDHKATPTPSKSRRVSIKGMFSRSSKKSKRPPGYESSNEKLFKDIPVIFDRSLTMEEEKGLYQMRSVLLARLVADEENYIQQLREISTIFMVPIAEGLDDVPTVLFSNQSLIFENLEEIKEFHSLLFLKDLKEHQSTPVLIGQLFKQQMPSFNKYKDYLENRSRSEVLLRELGNEPFLRQQARLTTNQESLRSCLLHPARHLVKYREMLQAILQCVRDDKESQREIEGALQSMDKLFSMAENVLQQVQIQGYHTLVADLQAVQETTHGCLLRHGLAQYAHDKKPSGKMSDLHSKMKHRHCFLFEKAIVVCKPNEDTSKFSRYVYKELFRLKDFSSEVNGNELIVKSPTERCVIQTDSAAKWHEDMLFINDNSTLTLSSSYQYESSVPTYNTGARRFSVKPTFSDNDEDDEVPLREDPDVDMFNLEEDDDSDIEHESLHNKSSNELGAPQQYMLMADYDNDLMLDRGDIVELVETRRDMMKIQIPGTTVSSWIPQSVLVPYS